MFIIFYQLGICSTVLMLRYGKHTLGCLQNIRMDSRTLTSAHPLRLRIAARMHSAPLFHYISFNSFVHRQPSLSLHIVASRFHFNPLGITPFDSHALGIVAAVVFCSAHYLVVFVVVFNPISISTSRTQWSWYLQRGQQQNRLRIRLLFSCFLASSFWSVASSSSSASSFLSPPQSPSYRSSLLFVTIAHWPCRLSSRSISGSREWISVFCFHI